MQLCHFLKFIVHNSMICHLISVRLHIQYALYICYAMFKPCNSPSVEEIKNSIHLSVSSGTTDILTVLPSLPQGLEIYIYIFGLLISVASL